MRDKSEIDNTIDTWVVGDAYPIQVRINNRTGATPVITGTPTAKIYKRGESTDLTATNLTGSCTASGNVVTTPTIQALLGGETYVLALTATVDGRTDVYQVYIPCRQVYGEE